MVKSRNFFDIFAKISRDFFVLYICQGLPVSILGEMLLCIFRGKIIGFAEIVLKKVAIGS
ncbi:hypothetical protein [Candidatus Liberibacter sp.]|uniref:hypothetical protein n=1 Tax=Candidatus Liberibacter sp. TaxID=34022 RepID=UPI0015F77E59|nr:hypothetical protein [Candidatus Liberibacter sp.]MBA5723755.1 hypothetical protein [Candidatus Liberibacter sp.]